MVRSRRKNLNKISSAVLVIVLFLALFSNSLFSVANAAPIEDPSVDVTAPIREGGPDIESHAAVVMDINSGAVLFAKNSSEALQPSSLTKLMTAYVTLCERSEFDGITCSVDAASQSFPTAVNVGYRYGESLTVEDALKGMLLVSAEDCTYSLAERTSGSVTTFAGVMNTYGDDLGFVNSRFVNASGYAENGHYSCAYDMGLVASKLMSSFPVYREILSESTTNLSPTNFSQPREITSKHHFMTNGGKFASVYAGKTGGSAYGGNGLWSLCTYASRGALDLVCIIMDAPTPDASYDDTITLFNYIFDAYETNFANLYLTQSTTELGKLFAECPLFDISSRSSIYIDPNAQIVLPLHADSSFIRTRLHYDQISTFVYGENIIGSVDFFYKEHLVGRANIIFFTEEASMSATEFAMIFPSFLVNPGTVGNSLLDIPVKTVKPTFFDKIKTGVSVLLTPAKLFALAIILAMFLIGAIVVYLLFPIKKGFDGNLYSSRYDDVPDIDYDGEALDVHRRRSSKNSEMEEF